MRCPYCGARNLPGADLCEACGADLAGLDLPEAQGGTRGRLLTDRIGDLKLAPAVTAAPDDTVEVAVERMREAGHGCILIEEEGELAGIFTERDLLVRVIRPGADPAAVRLGEVMSSGPRVLWPSDPPAFAIHQMVTQGLRHLPVVDGSGLHGFLSVRSVLRYLHYEVIGQGPADQ